MSESSSERVGPNGVVVWTDDADGVDKPAWTAMAKAILGSTPAIGARDCEEDRFDRWNW
jgi:hypothetical protein